jgi:hypothetical protein
MTHWRGCLPNGLLSVSYANTHGNRITAGCRLCVVREEKGTGGSTIAYVRADIILSKHVLFVVCKLVYGNLDSAFLSFV